MARAPVPAAGAPVSAARIGRKEKLLWACLLLAGYCSIATWGQFDFSDLMGYYTLQADAFLNGHIYVDSPPQQDLIPFEGRQYLQWGPFPALFHLAARIFDANLSDRVACILAGWLTALVFLEILLLLWRRYFPAVPKWVCLCWFWAFALATPNLTVAVRGVIYHESIAVAALCVLFGFFALLRSSENFSRWWILLCGAAIGAAVATRITQALYAFGLFASLAAIERHARRPLRTALADLAFFSAPVVASGLLMLAFNQARFHSPWEYGARFLPNGGRSAPFRAYALDRVPENFCHYVLAPLRFSRDLPWIRHIGCQPQTHTERSEDMSSVFLLSPFLLLGALAWGRLHGIPRILAWTAGGSGLLAFLPLLFFDAASRRYMQDFTPELMILAFLGVAARSQPGVEWRAWRPPAWAVLAVCALLYVHVSFFQSFFWSPEDPNVARTFVALSPLARRILPGQKLDEQEAMTRNDLGVICLRQGRYPEALQNFELAAQRMPHSAVIRQNLERTRRLLSGSVTAPATPPAPSASPPPGPR